MKSTGFIAPLCISLAVLAGASARAETTQTTTETKVVTVDGEVVRYDAGKAIVIRGADNKEITYTLSPTVVVPEEVKVGRKVTLYTEPGQGGATQLVSRVTTTSVMADGNLKSTTEETRTMPSGATRTTTTTKISGKVDAYDAGKTLTILRADGSKVTYMINEKSKLPAGLVVGKTVSIQPAVSSDAAEPVAETVTYTTTTTKTETTRKH
jgi:hypothetical protein